MKHVRHILSHSAIFVGVVLVMLALFGILRLALLALNADLWTGNESADVLQSLAMGARFDARVFAWSLLPVTLLPVFPSRGYQRFCLAWLTGFATLFLFFGVMELRFYEEFQQRLNDLVFQYITEDPVTVTGMIWEGTPVIRLTLAWLFLSGAAFLLIRRLLALNPPPLARSVAVILALVLFTANVGLARGTLRSGPPLRWGDAYQHENMFLNHLSLNGSFTLSKALMDRDTKQSEWLHVPAGVDPVHLTRDLLVMQGDTLLTPDRTVVRRIELPVKKQPRPVNIVIILMESFSGQFVGALGNNQQVTPRFDELAKTGLLYNHAFSNGTHTHQGTFATLACFPNLPGYEYLMQTSEGQHQFSGITALLPDHQSSFIYNGDFSWDNQQGFFRNQGMQKFVGRDDYIDPVFVDEVWGVSDEDMFNRGLVEIDRMAESGPFVAVLQSLSNHLPYNIPPHPEIKPVVNGGALTERLTAMKYSDWALGQFFDKARKRSWFKDTYFVVVGDHGFGTDTQLTAVNLLRFHVPMLFIGPDIAPGVSPTVVSQVDIVPTLAALSGHSVTHQCWGRNLLKLDEDEPGFAIIKPSGSEQTTAMIEGDFIVTYDPEQKEKLYRYSLDPPSAEPAADPDKTDRLVMSLRAYIAAALQSLMADTTYAAQAS